MGFTTSTIHSPEEALEYLLSERTGRPSEHPDIVNDAFFNEPHYYAQYFNRTIATGLDAKGQTVVLDIKHHGRGGDVYTLTVNGKRQYRGNNPVGFGNRTYYPVELLPAVSVVLFPDHTPQTVKETP